MKTPASAVRRHLGPLFEMPIDQERGPLVHFALVRLSPEEHVLALASDHIVFDGVSLALVGRELLALYPAFASGRPSPLAPLSVQIGDFAVWQRKRFTEEVLERERAYFREHFQDAPRSTALPADRPRSGVHTNERLTLTLDQASTARILGAAAGTGGPFAMLWTALVALLHEESSERDLVVGTFHANRSATGTEHIISNFANPLPVRVRLGADETLGGLRDRLRTELLDAFEHVDLPHTRVIEAVAPPPVPGGTPMFNVLFNQIAQAAPSPPDVALSAENVHFSSLPLDLSVQQKVDLHVVASVGDTLTFIIHYKDHFERGTIDRLAHRLGELVTQLADTPNHPLRSFRPSSTGTA